ncbi:ATP-binding protein [Phycicoccus sp. Root101]|uniref:ATP-binding protein n=1 Tax=Phycicoccus sp. Root101 TaxID=1736421 RepID=UPI000702B0F0|nr:ATP-binding protein [Phycicoccus sp. Root101]KQU64120.1 hypothetical protein ASC58_19595 [Phycicoccus sp. Root101]
MGEQLIIESLEIRTDSQTKVYEFAPGVTAVSGPLGTGKSSMLELIKYGLGGSAKVMPAVRDNVTLIVLRFRAGAERWQFTRQLGSHTVEVIDLIAAESLGTWAVTNRQNMRRVSPQLMGVLGLPVDWRVPSSRRKPRGATVPISFGDIYRYMYLDQNGIDKSVVGHDDRNLDNKRIAVFELLYGLSSPRSVELATRRGRTLEDAQRSRADATTVERFLRETGEPRRADLVALRTQANTVAAVALEEFEELRDSVSADLAPRALLAEIATLRQELDELVSQRNAVAHMVDEAKAVVAQLDLKLLAHAKAGAVSSALSGLDFVQCPRCLQGIGTARYPHDQCNLCGQHVGSQVDSSQGLARVLGEQRRETLGLLEEDASTLGLLDAQVAGLRDRLVESLRDEERRVGHPSAPQIDAVSEAATRLARAKDELVRLDAAEARWASHDAVLSEAEDLEVEARRLEEEELRLRLELSQNSSRVGDLSEVFDSILASLRDPWYQSARVSGEDYLPLVDDEPFDMLSVGGARKTIVNLAYHLANLSMSISGRNEILLPAFLIVDSPRKNVGEGEWDRAVVSAIYARLRTLQDASGDRFQIIFADNDLPPDARSWVNAHIELDYDHPFVPGVGHPGPDVETLGNAATVTLE